MPNSAFFHGYLPEDLQMSHTVQRQKNNSYEDLMRPDEDWRSLPDSADRRKIQNRLAQRSYRRNVKRQREELEELKLQLQGHPRKLQCNSANQAHFNQESSVQNFEDQNLPVLVPQSTPTPVNDAWTQAQKQQAIDQSRAIGGRPRAVSGNSSPSVQSQKGQYKSPAQHSQSMDFPPQNLQVAQPAPSRKRSFTDASSYSSGLQACPTTQAQLPQALPQQQQQQQPNQTLDMQSQASGTPALTPQQQPFSTDFQSQDLPYGDGGTSPPMPFGDMSCFADFTKTDGSNSEDGRQRDAGLSISASIPGISPNSQATFPPTPPVSGSLTSKTWPSSLSDEESIKFEDTSGQTMLHLAAEKGHEGILRLLLERGGIDIDSRDSGGYTALHRAVQRGRMGIVRILLEHEADMNARTTQFPY